jgi:hypothetical protein
MDTVTGKIAYIVSVNSLTIYQRTTPDTLNITHSTCPVKALFRVLVSL